jgi:type I restriction enzyme S subunit
MAGEWLNSTLGDVLTLQRGFDLPEAERKPGLHPIIASTGPVGTHAEAMVQGPGVVIGRSGSLGGGQYIESDFWPLNTTLWVKDFKGNDRRFCYYLLKSLDLAQFNAGSGVPTLNRNHIHPLPLVIPRDPREQCMIAHILSTLDDKIELNRRMNETLEAMARALFKSWFVDFDPVRAKAEGRDPGLPKPLADLFPTRLVESELGEIPEGWEAVTLGDLIDTVKGRSYKSEELAESDTALVTLKSFARGGGYRSDGLKAFTGSYKPEQVVQPGDLVIACTDVTQAAEVIGRPAIVRGNGAYSRLVASLDTLIVRPRDSGMTRSFLYFLGGTEAFVAHTFAHTTGTTVLHLAKEAVPSFRFPRPSSQLVEQFDALARPALERIQALEEESGTIAALRDTLLPDLISGKLRLEDSNTSMERRGA